MNMINWNEYPLNLLSKAQVEKQYQHRLMKFWI